MTPHVLTSHVDTIITERRARICVSPPNKTKIMAKVMISETVKERQRQGDPGGGVKALWAVKLDPPDPKHLDGSVKNLLTAPDPGSQDAFTSVISRPGRRRGGVS